MRHGTSTLLAAFNVRTGEVFGRCRRRTAAGLLRFLEELAVRYPRGDVYVIWDNLGEPTDIPARSPSRGPPYWESTVLRQKALGIVA